MILRAENVAEDANCWWPVSVPVISEHALSFSRNWGAQCSYFGADTRMAESLMREGILAMVSLVMLADSSVTSMVYWRAQCLVRIVWVPVWERTFSSALAGQTLGCTLGMKLDSSRTDCDLLWFSACWSSVREEAGNKCFWRRAQKDQCTCVLPDIDERGKKLDHLLQTSLDSHAMWQTCHPTAAAAAEIVTP